MLILEESYKKRIQQLAGIITEADVQTKTNMLSKSVTRVPFSREMMKQAIEEGREVGLLFKSDNENYKMPVPKYRVVRPMAMGTSADGNIVIRALHLIGQSERKAIETGKRSAEAEGEWRLFNANNIKGMWFTDDFFTQAPPGYNPNDKQISVQVAFNAGKAAQAQAALSQQQATDDEDKNKQADLDVMQKNIQSDPVEPKQVFAPGQFTNKFAG